MSLHPARIVVLCLLAAIIITGGLLVVGCQPEPTATALPTHTATPTLVPPTATARPEPTPAPLVFLPADEAPHDTPVEWWYFNGMLQDDAGGEYSYHFVTFQSSGPPGVSPHLLQATLGDHIRGVHYAAEKGALVPADIGIPGRAESRGVDVETGGWVMTGDGNGYEMRFSFSEAESEAVGRMTAVSVEIRAQPQREAVLHGGSGLVHLGPEAGSTYYYSRTRLDVTGWIEDSDGRRRVTGPGWMDHQWGEIANTRIGWDWASIQLDEGSDLMVAVVFQPNETIWNRRRPAAAHGTYVDPNGDVTHLPMSHISLKPQGSWTSPDTGVEYPMGWQVEVHEPRLELELTPYLEQAEFSSQILGVSYWEGGVSVAGQHEGRPVTGWGFVELVGYDPRQADVAPPMPTPSK